MNRLLVVILILVFALKNFAQTEEKIMLNKGVEAYNNGNFGLALEEFNNSYKTNDAYKKALFNAGNAALLNDSTQIAKDLFSEYLSVVDSKAEKNKGHYNLGNVQYKEYENLTKDPKKSQEAIKALKESIESYKNALRNNPKDSDARHNLRLAMSKLPPPNENQDQQNQENNQDQQNQDQNQDQQDQQNQENQQNENQNDQNKQGDQQKEGDKGDNQEQQNQENGQGDEQQDGEGQQNKEEQEKEGEQKGKQGEESKEKGEEEMKGRISRMQATKDLDALNNDEQKTLMKVNRKKGDQKQQNSSSKDW